jgi:hypothetical protein
LTHFNYKEVRNMGLKSFCLVVLLVFLSAGTALGGGYYGFYPAPYGGYYYPYGGYYSSYRGYYAAPYPYCCDPVLYRSWYIAQTNREINDIIRSTYEYRQRVMDHAFRQFDDYIRGDYGEDHHKH